MESALSWVAAAACLAAFSGTVRAGNCAVIIGPTYPGGDPFDDTIAQTRANAMAASLNQWGNWAGGVTTLTGGVTCAQITTAIGNCAATLVPGDIFLLIYHGHGSYVSDAEMVPPAADTCDETIWPNQDCTDDAITAALAGINPNVRKFVILASCYSGGFWNGNDPAGDKESLTTKLFLAGCAECECLPEPSVFVNNLLAKLDPAGWPGQNTVTFQEFVNAVTAGATGAVVNSRRWSPQGPLPKCPCSTDNVQGLYDFSFSPRVQLTAPFDTSGIFLDLTTVPAMPVWGLGVLGVLVVSAGLFWLSRRGG